jgi:uncharacterized membrane protein
MPCAIWVVVGLLVAMEIPSVGYWVAYLFVIFTFLGTNSLPAMIGAMFASRKDDINGPLVITQFIRSDGPAPKGWDYLWGLVGWTGVAWLATVAVLCAWIAIRMHFGQSVRGATNFVTLIIGWPICFWLAMRVLSTAAPR